MAGETPALVCVGAQVRMRAWLAYPRRWLTRAGGCVGPATRFVKRRNRVRALKKAPARGSARSLWAPGASNLEPKAPGGANGKEPRVRLKEPRHEAPPEAFGLRGRQIWSLKLRAEPTEKSPVCD